MKKFGITIVFLVFVLGFYFTKLETKNNINNKTWDIVLTGKNNSTVDGKITFKNNRATILNKNNQSKIISKYNVFFKKITLSTTEFGTIELKSNKVNKNNITGKFYVIDSNESGIFKLIKSN